MIPDGKSLKPLRPEDEDFQQRQQSPERRRFRSRKASLSQAYMDALFGETTMIQIKGSINFLSMAESWGDALVREKSVEEQKKWQDWIAYINKEIDVIMTPNPIRETALQASLDFGRPVTEVGLPGEASRATSWVGESGIDSYRTYAQDQIDLFRWRKLKPLVEKMAQFLMAEKVLKEEDDVRKLPSNVAASVPPLSRRPDQLPPEILAAMRKKQQETQARGE